MDPIIGSALISAGGSLLGGLFGRKSKPQQPVYVVPEYAQIRAKAEAAGFNPLTALTSAPGAVGNVSYQPNIMGEAIANAAMALADGLDPEKAARVEALELQNKDLQKRLQAATIRPAGPGLYAGRVSYGPLPGQGGSGGQASPRSGSVVSAGAAEPASSGVDPLFDRPLAEIDPVDPRRKVENQPINSTAGFMLVDNPWFPGKLRFPTIDGDEPLHWYEYPDLIVPGAIAVAEAGYNYVSDPARVAKAREERIRRSVMETQDHARGEGMLTADERQELRRFSRRYQLAKPNPNRTLFGVPYTSR